LRGPLADESGRGEIAGAASAAAPTQFRGRPAAECNLSSWRSSGSARLSKAGSYPTKRQRETLNKQWAVYAHACYICRIEIVSHVGETAKCCVYLHDCDRNAEGGDNCYLDGLRAETFLQGLNTPEPGLSRLRWPQLPVGVPGKF
jgi:hypothetical protein